MLPRERKIRAPLLPLTDARHVVEQRHCSVLTKRTILAALLGRNTDEIGPDIAGSYLKDCFRLAFGERVSHRQMALLPLERISIVFHLAGGGALSGMSRWSKGICPAATRALAMIRLSPETLRTDTSRSANHLPRLVLRRSYLTPPPLDEE